MDWMNLVGGLVKQYAGGTAQPGQAEEHYDQVQQNAPPSVIAGGLASAFGSGELGSFGQIAAQLFNNSNGSQQASMLNTLLATAGPALLSSVLSSGKMPGLASVLGGGGARELTPEEAAQVPPEEIQHLAHHVSNSDPSIVDRMGELYAAHPAVIKSLGGAAVAIAMAKIAQHSQR